MSNFDYIKAVDFDRAWLNFELDLPLETGANGTPNPFYINRPGDSIAELRDSLLSPFYTPPKFFFSGHRGCGKSTELLHLMANPRIKEKFWHINFSIKNEADIIDLDYRDVLLAVGSRMYRDYRKKGGELPARLLKDLDSWRGRVEEEVTTVTSGRMTGYEVGAGIDAFFANASMKMRLEPKTRSLIRQVIDKDVTGLIDVINSIAAAVKVKEGKIPLILIDDLDKPGLKEAKAIFQESRSAILQPNLAIVYTVSSALFYSKDFDAIRDMALFLPNVKLHPHHKPTQPSVEGYDTMRRFVSVRMDTQMIENQALNLAITYSGGVFREMARIMRTAIGRARRRKSRQIEVIDIEWAATDIRNEYRRILDKKDLEILRNIHELNRMEYNDRVRPLMQLLAILEYRNGENWVDVHPVLR
ncbi:MAG: hypothetical protein WCP19_09300, partial [Chloroflexota bacterium]